MTNNEVEKIKFFLTSFFSFYLVKIHKKQRNKLYKIYRQRFHELCFCFCVNMLR